MSVELLNSAVGIELLAVPYTGLPPAVADVVAGRVDVILTDDPGVAPHVKSGALRMLAAAGSQRLASEPDVPTIAERGVAGYSGGGWYGLLAPAGTPQAVLARVGEALAQARREPAWRKRLEQWVCEPLDDSPAQFRALMEREIERYSELARRARIEAR